MKTATELARELPAGPELDALFFERCWGWPRVLSRIALHVGYEWRDARGVVYRELPPVSTDAAACEAWAMRWAREKGLQYTISDHGDHVFATLSHVECWDASADGTDWKHALVRACIAAAEQLNLKGPEHGN